MPGTPAVAYSDPATGHYRLTVLQGTTNQVDVSAAYAGYRAVDEQVTVGSTAVQHDFAVPVDATTCGAPGYRFDYAGDTQGFDGPSTPDGWTVDGGAQAGGSPTRPLQHNRRQRRVRDRRLAR